MESTTTIHCPNCQFPIDVNELLASKLEAEYQQKLLKAINDEKVKLQEKSDAIAQKERDIETQKAEQERLINEQVAESSKAARKQLVKDIKTQLSSENEERLNQLSQELQERSEKIKELNTNHMYNSIKGIAGNAIQSIRALELPEVVADDNE